MKVFLTLVVLFAAGNAFPTKEYKSQLTYSNDAQFMLFTRNHPIQYQLIDVKNQSSLAATDFDPSKPTKILVHGWRNDFNTTYPQNVKNEYLKVVDVNVIIVDWSYASFNEYTISRLMVSTIAKKVGTLLAFLMDNGASQDSFHLVGHSLGAHIVGITGTNFIKQYRTALPRITGLDPAGPLFTYTTTDRIHSTSADFVDIIHSCGNILGFFDILGDIDFYPNGGIAPQPGCGLDIDGACSHGRSTEFFAESISRAGSFESVLCTDYVTYSEGFCPPPPYVEMGENVPNSLAGTFYLSTNDAAPYGRGEQYP